MNRREFLLSGSAALIAGMAWPARGAQNPQLRTVLDTIAYETLSLSPTQLTHLGLDVGKYAWARSRLDDNTAQARAHVAPDVARYRKLLATVPKNKLDARDKMLLASVRFCLDAGERSTRFPYGQISAMGGGGPYVVTQQQGAYQEVPEFLNAQHPIEDAADAEAYVARVAAMGPYIDHETEQLRHDAGLGVIPPDFVLDTAIGQQKALRAVPAGKSRLVESLARRAKEKKIADDCVARTEKLVARVVYPALDRQLAVLTDLRSKAKQDAGAWKLPDGEAYYAARLHDATSTSLTPAQIHKMGLDQGAELDVRMDGVLKAQGMSQGTVGERLAALSKDPKQLFADTDAGKQEAVAYVQRQMDSLRAFLPRTSKMQLKADVMVKRVPSDIEAGAPLGYMNSAPLDGSRPANYYINLKSTSSWPKFTIPSLSAHEALPGHCWQFAYITEHRQEVPLITSVMGFNAFVEGWALYAEQLVDELGFYAGDPLAQLGMYQGLRFRAARLVTDTGLHAMRWTREKAVEYLHGVSGRALPAVTSEVDRYSVSPGQACGYKVGHTEIVRLREKAKAALGAKLDVREFNDVVVQTGGVPLTVLATVVDEWIAKTKGTR